MLVTISKKSTQNPKTNAWIDRRDQTGRRPIQKNLDGITCLNEPYNDNELKSIFGVIQYLFKFMRNILANTDKLRQLLQKEKEHTEAFGKLHSKITKPHAWCGIIAKWRF